MKLTYIIIALMILCITFVSAVKPVTTTTQFTEGYVLKYPSYQVFKQNQNYEFEIHVFNISTGHPITSGISCYFHLYNSTGKHQLELTDSTVSHRFDYSFNVAGRNFSKAGDYYYIAQCNSSKLGGYVEVPIEVNPSGLTETLGFYFLLIIFSAGVIVLGYYVKDAWIVVLGSFSLVLVGLYILFYGLVGIKDPTYTWGIGLIILMLGGYFGIKASLEKIDNE